MKIFILLLLIIGIVNADNCTFINNNGQSFDLSSLRKLGYYEYYNASFIADANTPVNRTYNVLFNICGQTHICDYLLNTSNGSLEACQVYNDNNHVYPVGSIQPRNDYNFDLDGNLVVRYYSSLYLDSYCYYGTRVTQLNFTCNPYETFRISYTNNRLQPCVFGINIETNLVCPPNATETPTPTYTPTDTPTIPPTSPPTIPPTDTPSVTPNPYTSRCEYLYGNNLTITSNTRIYCNGSGATYCRDQIYSTCSTDQYNGRVRCSANYYISCNGSNIVCQTGNAQCSLNTGFSNKLLVNNIVHNSNIANFNHLGEVIQNINDDKESSSSSIISISLSSLFLLISFILLFI